MPEGGGFKRELTGPALGMLAVGFVLLLAFTTPLYRQIELKTLDMRFGARPALQQSDLILHVDIDDSTIESWGRWQRWSRDRHAKLLGILKELGARAVLFDIEFAEPSSPEDDNALARAIEATDFSFLPFRLELERPIAPEEQRLEDRIRELLRRDFKLSAMALSQQLEVPLESVDARLASLRKQVARSVGWEILRRQGELTGAMLLERLIPGSDPLVQSVEKKIIPTEVDRCLALKRIYRRSAKSMPKGVDCGPFSSAAEIEPPINILTRGCIGFGASNAPPDAEDGVLRHISLLFRSEGQLLPHLSLVGACWAVGTPIQKVEVVPGRHVIIHPTNDAAGGRHPIAIPIDEQCRTVVNWSGTRGTLWSDMFRHIPYGSILALDSLRENMQHNENVLRDVFGRNDQYLRGAWAAVETEVRKLTAKPDLSTDELKKLAELKEKQQAVETRMLEFLKRQTSRVRDEDLKKLPAEDRRLIEQMKLDLKVHALVLEARRDLTRREGELQGRLEKLIRDRLCVIGMTASGSTDLKATPIHPLLPGVGAHSAVINSILQRRFVGEAPAWLNVIVIIGVGLLVSVLASFLSTRWAALGTVAALVGWSAVAYLLFILWGWWVTMAGPVLAGFLSYAAITAYRQLTEERQKRHIRNAFHHYLSPAVVAEVLQNPEALKLGGDRKELTVFFSDVAGFTPIAEQMEPEELVALLNDYLSEMSDVILESKGYINKYEGDAIMAVFGAPLEDPDNPATACRVALESQRRLKDFRAKLILEKRPIIRARIGINSGIMIVGNMGSRTLFDYTVMGDNVNIGARLENANKNFGTEIIIGENTYTAVRDTFEARRLGLVNVKGRSKPVGAYELLAEKGKSPPLVRKLLPHYEEGMTAYSEQRWDAAIAAFNECLKINDKDGPSRAYLERCKHLAEQTSVEHWDGTFTLETK